MGVKSGWSSLRTLVSCRRYLLRRLLTGHSTASQCAADSGEAEPSLRTQQPDLHTQFMLYFWGGWTQVPGQMAKLGLSN